MVDWQIYLNTGDFDVTHDAVPTQVQEGIVVVAGLRDTFLVIGGHRCQRLVVRLRKTAGFL